VGPPLKSVLILVRTTNNKDFKWGDREGAGRREWEGNLSIFF
jgi:hypothetical protein